MVPVWYLLALLVVAALAAFLTYFITISRMGKPHFDELLRATVEAERAKTLHEAQEQVFEHIHPEVQYFVTTEKQFFVKRTRLVIRERLLYKHLPLMGWMEHSHLIDEHMDTAQLEEFAKAAARLIDAGADGDAMKIKRV
jgi:hypothetical protein